MTRPTRYTENNSSRDWIDEFCASRSAEEVRGAFLFNLGKYQRRYGKKDDPLQEAMKIQDYANRLVDYERSLVKPVIRELYTDADQEKARTMIAAAWEEGEKRMEQIGPNGNDGLAYENGWIPTTTDDLLAEIEAQAAAMTDTAATLVRTIRVQQVTIATLEAALKESRANDFQGMRWLSEVAEAAGLRDVDMPTLIDHVRALRAGTI